MTGRYRTCFPGLSTARFENCPKHPMSISPYLSGALSDHSLQDRAQVRRARYSGPSHSKIGQRSDGPFTDSAGFGEGEIAWARFPLGTSTFRDFLKTTNDEIGKARVGRQPLCGVGFPSGHVAAMPNPKDPYAFTPIIDFVNHAIVADSDAPVVLGASQFMASRRSRNIGKCLDTGDDD